jgi:hypothetical protein
VLANDVDVDGDAYTVTIDTPPAFGTASVSNNQILFPPPADYTGPASLVYRVRGQAGQVRNPVCGRARPSLSNDPAGGQLVVQQPGQTETRGENSSR